MSNQHNKENLQITQTTINCLKMILQDTGRGEGIIVHYISNFYSVTGNEAPIGRAKDMGPLCQHHAHMYISKITSVPKHHAMKTYTRKTP